MKDLFNYEKFSEIITTYTPKFFGAILTLIIGFWIIGFITRWINKLMTNRNIDATIRPFLSSLVGVGLRIMLLLSVANQIGIETTSFIAIFSAMAFAIGLALQGSLGHFASGVLLLVFKPYKVGDVIELAGGKRGTVLEVQVFNTVLKTPDNKRIIVPNGLVTSNVITNITGQDIIGLDLFFGIGYEDDIDKAKEVILQVGKNCPYVLEEPEQVVFVSSLGDSSVNFMTRPFCKSDDFRLVNFYMTENVKKEFDKAGIGIPFPQMDVHMIPNKDN